MRTPIKARIENGFGIINHHGEFWTTQFFFNEDAAQRYLDDYRERHQNTNMKRHKVVPARLTLDALKTTK